jgi:hypothetical protein
MPFIGQEPLTGAYHVLDAITASTTATYNLQLNGGAFSPATANQLLVSLNGVIQKPGSSFTISGSQITFSSALSSSDSIDFIIALGDVLSVGTPTDGSVVTAKIAPNAVTDAKIAGMAASKLTGALPALDGSALTNVTTGVVAFHARYIDSSVGTLANGNYVIFQTVDTNEGSGYNNTDGIFTVPAGKGGTYYFYSRLLYDKNSSSDTDTNYKTIEFRKNNSLVGGLNISHYYGRGDYDYVDGTMCVNLAAGDTMRIYNSGNATLYAGSYSSFNGFRIG